ncbi:MAG: preprotein translocase subunit TatB [Clostridiaceae bacterium]|jgi:tRNA 2-thiouridine synthesizing protein A|nr:preprotein translocase subunit TatB [Clostridiaceae bacterium]HZJ90366.1 sulfurtransferase TusA family protein [Oscillospiraceae bacterium]
MKTVDARGLSCPEPVFLAKKAMDAGEYPFAVLVDDSTPLENIKRFANQNKQTIEVDEAGGEYTITFVK